MYNEENIIYVPKSRLSYGYWCHTSDRQKEEGDICAAYSGDVIAMEGRVRKPFQYKGGLYVSVGGCNKPKCSYKAYKLIEERHFEGKTITYADRCRGKSRDWPHGFYHGMRVKHGKKDHVLSGKPLLFVESDEVEMVQGSLF